MSIRNIEKLKKKIAGLRPKQQSELRNYLCHLKRTNDPEYKRMLAERLDDEGPRHWLTLDEVEKRIKQSSKASS